MLYLTFKTNAPQVKILTAELEKRAGLAEYQGLLVDCHNCYFNQRRQLLLPIISASLRKLASSTDLQATVRTGCAYVINVSCLEFQLYHAFFEKPSTALRDFLGGISVDLYEIIIVVIIIVVSFPSKFTLIRIDMMHSAHWLFTVISLMSCVVSSP